MTTRSKDLEKVEIKKSRSTLVVGLIVLLIVVVLVSVIGWIVLKPTPEIIQGEVEANEVRVSSKLAGRILSFGAGEGDLVHVGDLVVKLSSPELLAKLAQAEAAESAAIAQNKKALKGAREEQIRGAFEMWQKAKIGFDLSKKSYDRAKKLYENEVIPAQKFDEAEAQYRAAAATEKAAKSQYDMAKNGAENEDKQASLALVTRAKGAVSEIESYLPETNLMAPITGEISEIYPKVGELVGQGAPIMTLVDLNDCWITFHIREDQLRKYKMGASIQVSIPALNLTNATFKISYMKALGSYATWKATKTTGDFDRKTFEIRAKPTQKINDLRPGMSVLLEEKAD
jgi:HlyD family secretion protein